MFRECNKKIFYLLLILFLPVVSSSVYAQGESLGVFEYLTGKVDSDPIFEAPLKEEVRAKKLEDKFVPSTAEKIKGKMVDHPTNIALAGLYRATAGHWAGAKVQARRLMSNSITIDGGLFFPFMFDYGPMWPYQLKAPWISALPQGYSLALFSYLYKKTGEKEFLETADKVYLSYLVPIEKGGFARYGPLGPFFDEYTNKIPTYVMNGSIIAMLALHDYAVISGNKEAMDLFKNGVKRFAELLPEYEIIHPATGIVTSSYALAPRRQEVLGRFVGFGDGKPDILGRFVGDGNVCVNWLSISARRSIDGLTQMLASLEVGKAKDDDVQERFYLWSDAKLMNWGEPVVWDEKPCREVNGNIGSFKHSPFKFKFSSWDAFYDYEVHVAYTSHDLSQVHLQLFDEQHYWDLGVLDSHQSSQYFAIPSGLVNSWRENAVVKNAFIYRMRLLGLRAGKRTVLESLDVGTYNDDNAMERFFIWPGVEFLNWGGGGEEGHYGQGGQQQRRKI